MILLFWFHTIITNYIAPIIYSFNGGNKNISVALMIAGCVEIPVILFFSVLIKRISVINIVACLAIFFLLRNILLLLSGSVSMVLFSQSFQAFSFALFIPASAYFMHRFTMPADNVRAQTILSIAMTSGGGLGSIMGGVLLEFIDINRILFLSLFVVSGGLWLIIKVLRSKSLYNAGESQRII
ncbi:MAG: MFS transporter [Klebsiella michiganensis]|nr:MFS transporter [Klebsiella michiganensis]